MRDFRQPDDGPYHGPARQGRAEVSPNGSSRDSKERGGRDKRQRGV